MDDYRIEWETLEYRQREKRQHWYAALWIAAVAIAAIAVILGNYLFAIFIIVGAATLTIHALKEPRPVSFSIMGRGVAIGNTLHPYSTLHSFWVEERGEPKLLIRGEKFFAPLIVIPLSDVDTVAVRDYLMDYLSEVEHFEPLSQKIMERLGF